jgi:hypothetical protein
MKIIYKHLTSHRVVKLDLLHDDIEQKFLKYNLSSPEWEIKNNFLYLSWQCKPQWLSIEVLRAISEAYKRGIPDMIIGQIYEHPHILILDINDVYLGSYNFISIKSLDVLYPDRVIKFYYEDEIYAFELNSAL